MKLARYTALAAVVVSLISFGQSAFAQSTYAAGTTDAITPSVASANTGKTRADVRAELLQAEQQGLLPTSKTDYPPTPHEIAQNRAEYQARHLDNRVNMASN